MKFRVLFVLLALTPFANSAEPVAPSAFSFGKKIILPSVVLGENRILQISVPADYDLQKSYYPLPVLYLLDGEYTFFQLSGLIDSRSCFWQIPPMIVVAINNTDRTRDLTPTHSMRWIDGKPTDMFQSSGAAEKFLAFMRSELIPYIDKNYHTAPFRILYGLSLGGLFTLNVLQKHPETFQAYIAGDPSLWWDDQIMLKTTGPIGRTKQYLFISVSNAGGIHRKTIDLFVELLKERAAPGFAWHYKAYEDETHTSVIIPTTFDALKFIFSEWPLPHRGIEEKALSYAEVTAHYHALSEKYGYTIVPPLDVVCHVPAGYSFQEIWDDAVPAWTACIHNYPEYEGAYVGLGYALAKKGEKEAAVRAYQQALKINPGSEGAKQGLEKLAPPLALPSSGNSQVR